MSSSHGLVLHHINLVHAKETECPTLDTVLYPHCFYFSFIHSAKVPSIPVIVVQEITQEKDRM